MTGFFWTMKRIMPVTLRVFFGRFRKVNYQRVPEGDPIIFVANHPSALMDPLVCGIAVRPGIHFLGRADLYKKKLVSKALVMTHMWPIYRDVDGKDALSKNKEVFAKCYDSLSKGNPILLYGEGLTDERFIRRVKKVKKGAARIAFGAEESRNFKMGLKVIPVGINYTNSEHFHSDVLVRFGEPLVLSDYKESYTESPSKAMLEVTRILEERILNETISIENLEDTPLFEEVLMLFEDTMHYYHIDGVPSLEQRWDKTKSLAEKMNNCDPEKRSEFYKKVSDFWRKINPGNSELFIIRTLQGKKVSKAKEILELILGFPFALVGAIVNFPAIYLLKTLPMKLTSRVCFYSGMRAAIGTFIVPIFLSVEYLLTIPFIDIPYLYPMILIGGIITGIYTMRYRDVFRRYKRKTDSQHILGSLNQDELKNSYNSLVSELENLC